MPASLRDTLQRHIPKEKHYRKFATKKHYRKHATNNKQNNNGSNRNGARVVLFSYRAVQYGGQKASGSLPLTGASHHSIGALEQYIVQCLLSPGSDRDGRTARLISQKGKAACLYGGTDERADCCRSTSYTCTIPRWGVHLLNTNSIHVTGGRNLGG
jgi:hypothetical protein